MTANLFFVTAHKLGGGGLDLDGDENRHLRAARIEAGDEIWLFDETGSKIRAVVESTSARSTRLRLGRRAPAESVRLRVTLAQSLLKSKAMDQVIEQAVEWGVRAVAPVISRRTVVAVEDRAERKVGRWNQIARAAAAQSGNGRVPRIDVPVPLAEFLEGERPGRKIVLSEHGGRPFKELADGPAAKDSDEAEDWTLLLGPEGGWSAGELEAIAAAGYEPASLGPRILRAPTAAVSALAVLIHRREP